MRWRSLLLGVGLVLVGSRVVEAQAITSYELHYYAVGAAVATATEGFSASSVVCNQAPPTSTVTVNPTMVVWDDPALPGRVCRWDAPATALLQTAPIGAWEAALVAINSAGVSPESARAPFSRAAVPAPAPTGLRVVRP